MHEISSFPDDLALQPVVINHAPGPEYGKKRRKWQGIPGIERAANGRLWATWYTGGRTEDEDNHVVLVSSDDEGKSWSEPVVVIDPPGDVRASDSVLWHDPQGRLWLFWMQSAHCGITFDGRAGVWFIRCEDSGSASPAWSAPRRIANGIMMNKPTVLSTGEWLLPTAIWSHMGPYRHSLPDEQFSNITISRDRGETFELFGSADVPNRDCDEHMIVERRDGTLWMLVRLKEGIGEAVSHDRGRSWTASPQPVLPGPSSRFFIRRLRSGRLLLINHHESTGRSHLTAMLSEDDGATWPHSLLLDEREMVTYPDAVETPEGRIFMIYDRQRVGEGEILLQTFTEDDILAKRSPGHKGGRLQIVSKIERANIGSRRQVFTDDCLIDQKKNVSIKLHSFPPREVALATDSCGGNGHGVGLPSPYFSINRDDFVSVNAPVEGGELTISPIWFEGQTLELNFSASTSGSIRVEIQDWRGSPIEGYTLDDCDEIIGDALDRTVRWKGVAELGAFQGDLIRLRFRMIDSDLFSFQFIG